MKRLTFFAVGLAALLCMSAGARAQCVGDCNGDGQVLVNEMVIGVNIALGVAEASACPSFDVNGDGSVGINELITGVNNLLNGCTGGTPGPTVTPTPGTGPVCGDGNKDAGEDCDDGNNFGGDGCAANCTTETSLTGTFDSTKTKATVQTQAIPIVLSISGHQTFTLGKKRADAVTTQSGPSFAPGEIPLVIKASELVFEPVKVTGLVCACVRGVPVDTFGPGNSATGSVGCGEAGLTDINYRLIQDHNTDPGDPNNANKGTPDDPNCTAVTDLPGGQTSSACREGSMAPCNLPSFTHIGVCNGPRTLTLSGGMAPRGSALILNSSSISLLQDAGACSMAGPKNGKCPYPDYGPDCLPCTADDAVIQDPNILPTTTGTSEAAVFDANNTDAIIDKDQSCFSAPGQFCKTQFNGSIFDCDKIENNDPTALSGGSITVSFPSLDAAQIGDNVTSTVFFNQ
jgi:cysteine-rich repeat protein